MNELRVYVEHLFEGKVLTPENIELKEEIYGNLVARYEDLLAEGVSEEEALERTKESMPSLDELDEDASFGDASASSIVNVCADGDERSDETPISDETPAVDAAPASVTADAGLTGRSAPHLAPEKVLDLYKVLKYGLIVAAIIIVMGIAAKLTLGLVDEGAEYGEHGTSSVQGDSTSAPQGGSGPQGAAANGGEAAITVDEAGRVWMEGEPGDELLASVVDATPSDVSAYVDTKLEDAATVESLLHALPLGEFATDVDVTRGPGVLCFAYREVPEAYDGDSVDVALAYNVAVLFGTIPAVNEIQVTVAEQDEPTDENHYVFTRDDVQGAYGITFSGEMMNESGWRQIKEDNLYTRKFAERLAETAEREWR